MISENSIIFPHLHLVFENVGQSLNVFGFTIAYYGMVIALGMLLAGAFIIWEARRLGYNEDDFLDMVITGIICGVIGARIYYVVFAWERYQDDVLSVFNIRQGGLAIYGGIIGGLIAVIVTCRRKGISFFMAADVLIFGVLIGQIMGRFGNFFNREAFGGYTDGPFAMLLPREAVRQPEAVTDEMLAHLVNVEGIDFISVHPTFLYESVWNLGVLLFLLYFRKRKRVSGEVFLLYIALYGAGRFWIEGLRTDSLMLFGTPLAVSQCLAAICVVVGTGMIAYRRWAAAEETPTDGTGETPADENEKDR